MLPGVKKAEILSHWGTQSQSGTPGLAVKCKVFDGFGAEEDMIGTIWFSQKAAGMARAQLKAIGFSVDGDDLESRLSALCIDNVPSLVGGECEVTLAEEDYKGVTRVKISRFGSSVATPPTRDSMKAAAEMLKAAKKSELPTGDDIPF